MDKSLIEEKFKNQESKLKEHEKRILKLENVYLALNNVDNRVKNIESDVLEIKKTIKEINPNNNKAKKWDKLVDYIFYFIMATILVYIASKLGLEVK